MAYKVDSDIAVYPIIEREACMAKVGLDKSSLVSTSKDRLKVDINSRIKAKNRIKIPEPRIFNLSSMIMYTNKIEKAKKLSAS